MRVEGGVVDPIGSASARSEENIERLGREGAQIRKAEKKEKEISLNHCR